MRASTTTPAPTPVELALARTAPHRLTCAQLVVLLRVARGVRDIRELEDVAPRVRKWREVERLVRAGLLRAEEGPDLRRRYLSLTDYGAEVARAAGGLVVGGQE